MKSGADRAKQWDREGGIVVTVIRKVERCEGSSMKGWSFSRTHDLTDSHYVDFSMGFFFDIYML